MMHTETRPMQEELQKSVIINCISHNATKTQLLLSFLFVF